MVIAIPRFPSTNNEKDVLKAFHLLQYPAEIIPHYDFEKIYETKYTGIVIPGGFSYGDYLRPGAIAAQSEMMTAIKNKYQEEQTPILGICNGLQILTEAKMLPGVLLKNHSTRFICKWVQLLPNNQYNPLLIGLKSKKLRLPIAHYEGCYYIEPNELKKIITNNQILFQYNINPNGSVDSIAGVSDEFYRVFGMMPHPERAAGNDFGSKDGLYILQNFLQIVKGAEANA